jgi:hypothetical protein
MPGLRLLHPSAYPNAKRPFANVTMVDAVGLEPGIERLATDGGIVLSGFAPAFRFLAEQCGASTAKVMHMSKDGPHPADATSIGPLKASPRILEKCLNDYRQVRPPYAAVCDVVRGTMAFAGPREMLAALEKLVRMDGAPLSNSGSTRYRIAQVKELYSKNLQSMYGDVKLSMLFFVDGVPDGHVCELQLNTVALIAAKASPEGHVAYEVERTLENTWDREHPNARLPSLEQIEADLAAYLENPSDPNLRNYGGQSSGMQGATVEDYIDLYRPLIGIAQKANAAARKAFDTDPDGAKLISRVGELARQVATRWSDRFEKNESWSQLS